MAVINSKVISGELAGATSATQGPDIDCLKVTFKAVYGNSGNVYLGGAGVTIVDASTDATTGLELDAGDEVSLVIGNLNEVYRICDNAGDDLTYIALTAAA
jgi:hypothetical protein